MLRQLSRHEIALSGTCIKAASLRLSRIEKNLPRTGRGNLSTVLMLHFPACQFCVYGILEYWFADVAIYNIGFVLQEKHI